MLNILSLHLDYQKLTEEPRTHLCATGHPVFAWALESSCLPDAQRSFRLKFTCPASGFRYQTGEILTSAQHYAYDGPELPLGQNILVELLVRSEKSGEARRLSFFTVAAVEAWKAGWIGPAQTDLPRECPLYFRKEFKLRKKVKCATLYVCGIGYQRVWLNGAPLERNAFLDPAPTDYSRRCLYVTYPGLPLENGENYLGVEVGLGWRDNSALKRKNGTLDKVPFQGDPCLTAMLHVVYERGGDEWLLTDESWDCGLGPMTYADIYDGTVYDARRENPSWCLPGFQGFGAARSVEGPGGKLEPMTLPPVCGAEMLPPVAKWHLGREWLFDFGRNVAGVLKLSLPRGLRRGQKIVMRHSEELDADGALFPATLRSAKATDVYVASGSEKPGQTYLPYFTYHGFRYVSIECPPEVMLEEDPMACTIRNPLDRKTMFRCGDALVNAFADACLHTEQANIHNLLTDCPQRNERMGWMNDATVRFEAFPYCFEANQLFRKVTRDILDEQGEDGGITCTAPFVWGNRPADPVCSSFLIAGWQNFLFDGDTAILAEAYPAYQAWTNCLLHHRDGDGTVNYSYYGDWAAPAAACGGAENACSIVTPGTMVSTGFLYYDCKLLAEIARVLGKDEDARRYQELQKEVGGAILKKWYDARSRKFAGGSQGSQALMLWLGLFPKKDIPEAMRGLCAELRESGYVFTTGNILSRYLYEMLIEHGCVDNAWAMLTRQEYPSFGYMFQQEATTIWERFEQKRNGGMNSHCHPMHASVSYVLYACLAGIKPLEPGFRRISIRPHFPTRLLSLETTVETILGTVGVHWFKRYGALNLMVNIPFGATAEVDFHGKVTEVGAGFHAFTAPCEEGSDVDW